MMSSICFLEAIVALEGQQNQLNKLIESLNITIGEIQRSPQQRSSNEMSALTASKDAATNLLNQLKPSLSAAIEKVLRVAEVITPSVNSVQKTLNNPILKRNKALRDNLILQSILDHAITQSDTTKVFLSSNTKEFGNAEARFALRTSDVMYFSNTNSLISWIDSQS
jgi:hypothetical protein